MLQCQLPEGPSVHGGKIINLLIVQPSLALQNPTDLESDRKRSASWENGGLTAGSCEAQVVELGVRKMIVQSDRLCGGEGLEALTCTQHM